MADAPLAHQFQERRQQEETAELGTWTFLLTEILLFAALFAGYVTYRTIHPAAFEAGARQLDVVLGTTNTAVLLVSSFFMAVAVHQVHHGRNRPAAVALGATALLGAIFLAIKFHEYDLKVQAGHFPGPGFTPLPDVDDGAARIFFSFYFVMTGWHALHLLIGVVAVLVVLVRTLRGRNGPHDSVLPAMVGLYWHFVDVLWVFLFPLLYLPGRSA